jgi:polyhydroxyalkanoate synthesis regulator phasin
MKRFLIVGFAAVLVAGGALVAVAQTDEGGGSEAPERPRFGILGEVLDELVSDGVLDESQAEAVLDAVAAKKEEIRAERQALREQIQEFLSDGVITQDEIAQLPEDSRARQVLEELSDDEITVAEFRRLFRHHRGR